MGQTINNKKAIISNITMGDLIFLDNFRPSASNTRQRIFSVEFSFFTSNQALYILVDQNKDFKNSPMLCIRLFKIFDQIRSAVNH